jgi:hypothetical protein
MNPDFRDLLAEFNAHNVDYLIVGAHALAAHGHIRATKYLDVWVRAEPDNARKVLRVLKAFGAPLQDLTENDLTLPGLIFQIGVPPVRIDLVSSNRYTPLADRIKFIRAMADLVRARAAARRGGTCARASENIRSQITDHKSQINRVCFLGISYL